jgi:hypothetical protein
LEQSIYITLTPEGDSQTEEGLNCVAELIYNQTVVSQRMWNIFGYIHQSYITDQGIIDEFIVQAGVSIINFMTKASNEYKTFKLNGQ